MALLGLLLIPSDYRAGAEFPHAHSIVQLWFDTGDGTVHHHHELPATAQTNATDWFDPAGGVSTPSALDAAEDEGIDVGAHHDSAPVSSDAQMLLVAMVLMPAIESGRSPRPRSSRLLAGRSPRIPLPPPRSMPAMA
jgi:hypothetical protein